MWGQEGAWGMGRDIWVGCVGVHLTKGHPAQSSTKLDMRCLYAGSGVAGGMAWQGVQMCKGCRDKGVYLIKDQPNPKANQMSS